MMKTKENDLSYCMNMVNKEGAKMAPVLSLSLAFTMMLHKGLLMRGRWLRQTNSRWGCLGYRREYPLCQQADLDCHPSFATYSLCDIRQAPNFSALGSSTVKPGY
jgi:hypothetical protein